MMSEGNGVNQQLFARFLAAYQSIRPLTAQEIALIPTELIYNYLHKLEWRMTAMLSNSGYIEMVKESIAKADAVLKNLNELQV